MGTGHTDTGFFQGDQFPEHFCPANNGNTFFLGSDNFRIVFLYRTGVDQHIRIGDIFGSMSLGHFRTFIFQFFDHGGIVDIRSSDLETQVQ